MIIKYDDDHDADHDHHDDLSEISWYVWLFKVGFQWFCAALFEGSLQLKKYLNVDGLSR